MPQALTPTQPETLVMCALRVGPSLFGIEASLICELLGEIHSKPVPLAPKFIAGIIPYRGDVLTTLSLRQLLGAEDAADGNCVVVLNNHDLQERFGLVVDKVHGLITVEQNLLEPNPTSLDAPATFLFDGVYRTGAERMVRLNTCNLRPSSIAQSGLFDHTIQQNSGRIQ